MTNYPTPPDLYANLTLNGLKTCRFLKTGLKQEYFFNCNWSGSKKYCTIMV